MRDDSAGPLNASDRNERSAVAFPNEADIEAADLALAPLVARLAALHEQYGFTTDAEFHVRRAPLDLPAACLFELLEILRAGELVVLERVAVFRAVDLYIGDLFYDLFETIADALGRASVPAGLRLDFARPLVDLLAFSKPWAHDVGLRNLSALAAVMADGEDQALAEWAEEYARQQSPPVREAVRRVLPRERTQMYLDPQTVNGKTDLADLLSRWLSSGGAETIGEPGSYSGKAHIRVVLAGTSFHLNADTTKAGVQAYLALVTEHGKELTWNVVASKGASKQINKVAPGPDVQPIPGFYLYADEAAQAPHSM